MSDKLEADKRERREANACFALHLMTEHGKKELQQLGSKKKKSVKQKELFMYDKIILTVDKLYSHFGKFSSNFTYKA